MLTDGHIQGFIDFMYLTHRRELDRTRPSDEELIARRIDPERYEGVPEFPAEHVPALYAHLTAADDALRHEDVKGAYQAYESLGDYFERSDALQESAHFFRKCLAISREIGWTIAEMSAEARLGDALAALGEGVESIRHHERHLELAREQGAEASQQEAQDSLLAAYMGQAGDLEARGDHHGALEVRRGVSIHFVAEGGGGSLGTSLSFRSHIFKKEAGSAISLHSPRRTYTRFLFFWRTFPRS
jgi:hypothetical protein